jgi:hypothetical protein
MKLEDLVVKKNNELSIKSKLLFNKIDTCVKVVTNKDEKADKRKKQLDNIFSIYKMTVNPFVSDESIDYQDTLFNNIKAREDKLVEVIDSDSTVEVLLFEINPIVEHLKEMVSTCKTNMDKINALWGVK